MLYNNIMMSCAQCISGHRANSCQHKDRPLFIIKNKGRGAGLHHSSQKPDFPLGITDPALHVFYQTMMEDPKMYREYYHDTTVDNSTQSPPAPCKQPTAPQSRRQQSGRRKVDDMYSGSLSTEQVDLWKQLCGHKPMTTKIFSDPNAVIPEAGVASSIPTQVVPPTPAVEAAMSFPSNFQPLSVGDTPSPNLDPSQVSIPFEDMMNMDDLVSYFDPAPQLETIDVIEVQRRHPHLILPIAWSPEVEVALGDTAKAQEMGAEWADWLQFPDEDTSV